MNSTGRTFSKVAAVLALLALPAQFSYAYMIGTDLIEGGPDAICYVTGGTQSRNGPFNVDFSCSGTLITPTQVLTAGHCVTPLENNPKLAVKVFCGFMVPRLPTITSLLSSSVVQRPLADSFKESFMAKAAFVDPDYSGEPADVTHDFAVIQLPRSSGIQPLPFLKPVQSIQEFLGSKESVAYRCSGAGFGIDSRGEADVLHMGDLMSSQLSISLSFTRPIQGMVNAISYVSLVSNADIAAWGKFEYYKKVAEVEGLTAGETDFEVKEFEFLDQRKLIKASLMPGDSGGPLLCRESESSPWKIVGVASSISLNSPVVVNVQSGQVSIQASSKNGLPIRVLNVWVTPDLSRATKLVPLNTQN